MKVSLSILCFLFFTGLQAQSNIPEDYFSNPLDIQLVLAGSFGELRSNHFHSGLDIKTNHHQGLEVRAAANGYISRINIQHYGYGKALYIQHPNGYTTVYGHLLKLAPQFEDYLEKRQYEKESYEIEIFPEADVLPVKKGQLIAYSGNTGGSGGPHLHFEIRDGNQRPMNPEMFGIDIADSRPPLINDLFAYPLGEGAYVENSAERQKIQLIPLQDGSYTTKPLQACGTIGFGISTVDQKDYVPNKDGVYKIDTKLNGDEIFELNFQKFSFSESRRLNQLIDYEYYANNNERIQKLFKEDNNPLSLYGQVVSGGKLTIQDSLSYQYVIRVSDYKGNQSIIRVPIEGKYNPDIPKKDIAVTNYFAQANQPFTAEANGMDVYIPKNSLYEDTFLDIQFKGDTLQLDQDDIPLQNYMTIGFDASKYSAEDREKLFIARLGYRGQPNYSSTHKKGTRFTTKTRTFGDYTLVADVKAPQIIPLNFKDGQWISGNSSLQVKITDDLSGIKSYRATVNGKFILMEYEYKNNTLTHYFDDDVLHETENHLKVIVTDNVGNSNTYEATFFRKE